MFKLPTAASMKTRLASRKRGVSIENVMLGLIIVLIFAGLLYGAFTVVQRYIAKNTAQRVMPMASSEARLLYRNQTDFNGLAVSELIAAGAIPLDSIENEGTPTAAFVLPFGGDVTFAETASTTNAGTFDATVTWDNDGRNAVALCTTMASGELNSANPISGPMGSDYTITAANCASATPTLTVNYERG